MEWRGEVRDSDNKLGFLTNDHRKESAEKSLVSPQGKSSDLIIFQHDRSNLLCAKC